MLTSSTQTIGTSLGNNFLKHLARQIKMNLILRRPLPVHVTPGTLHTLIPCHQTLPVAWQSSKCWMTGFAMIKTDYSFSAPWVDLAKAPSPGNGLILMLIPLNGQDSFGGHSTKAMPVLSTS